MMETIQMIALSGEHLLFDAQRESICHPIPWDGRAPMGRRIREAAWEWLHADAELLMRFKPKQGKDWYCLVRAVKPAELPRTLIWAALQDAREWPQTAREEVSLLYWASVCHKVELPQKQAVLSVYRDVMSAEMASAATARAQSLSSMQEADTQAPMRTKIVLLLFSALLAFLFDNWFTKAVPGISVPLYVAMLLGAAAWSARSRGMLRRWQPWVLAGVTWLLSASYALYMNPVLRVFNVMALPLLTGLTCIGFAGDIQGDLIYKWWARLIDRPFGTGYKIVPVLSSLWKRDMKRENKQAVNQVLIGILIAVPILMVIFRLLVSADLIFASYVDDAVRWFERIEIGEFIGHALLVIAMFYYLFGYIWSLRYPAGRISPDPLGRFRIRSVHPMVWLTVIGLLCALYAVFTVIQSSYLYTGVYTWRIPEGYTYAEYARRGFFEMVAVAGINILLILISLPQGEAAPERTRTVRLFATALWAFSLNMLFVSVYKMTLYIDAYGFTRLRIFVLAVQLAMAVGLAVLLIRIWKPAVPFVRIAASVAVCVYLTLNLINVDAVIVRGNLALYQRTGRIDTEYMRDRLCPDAVPALRSIEARIGDEDIREEIEAASQGYVDDIHQIDYDNDPDTKRPYPYWHQWNLSAYRALH